MKSKIRVYIKNLFNNIYTHRTPFLFLSWKVKQELRSNN